jgi:hypothetical protein
VTPSRFHEGQLRTHWGAVCGTPILSSPLTSKSQLSNPPVERSLAVAVELLELVCLRKEGELRARKAFGQRSRRSSALAPACDCPHSQAPASYHFGIYQNRSGRKKRK